jgi:hypothetical protein
MAQTLHAALNQHRRDSGIPHESASGAFGIIPKAPPSSLPWWGLVDAYQPRATFMTLVVNEL